MFIEGSVVSKNAKRIISTLISFVLIAFAISQHITNSVNEHYHPESYNEYWILFPIIFFICAVYFIVCAFQGRFMLWKSA